MATRLKRRLRQAEAERRGILMGFLPAGYPSPDGFVAAASAAFGAGLDVLEVSMPGPAPALDGPLIQAAAVQAAEGLAGIPEALRLAASSRHAPDDTIVALAYQSTFETIGIDEFFAELEAADVDAFLLAQHPVADQLDLGLRARARGLEPVIFLHLQEDLDLIAASALEHPVIYLQSADLRTGGAFNAGKARERLEELAEAMGGKPYAVCVGFGVRGHDEAQVAMSAGADGVVIGTRLVAAAAAGTDAAVAVVDDVAPALVRRHSDDAHPSTRIEVGS